MFKLSSVTHQFAAAYNCNAYGVGEFNAAGEACTTTLTPPNTGTAEAYYPLFGGLTAGVIMVTIAVVITLKSLKKRRQN